MKKSLTTLLITASTLLATQASFADEGMWLYNEPPTELIQQRYGVKVSDQLLEHLQKSSVRLNNGGSGSFVSSQGLLLTNHHVGADAIYHLSDEKNNYLEDGFYAPKTSKELKIPGLEVNVLESIQDVTDQVLASEKEGMSESQRFEAKRALINKLEKESLEKTGLRSDVVTLFQGGAYHLYRYQRFEDIRLVFAPESQSAFYGGDSDNFEYPRYCYDMCLFRVYKDGKPYEPSNHLTWSQEGLQEGEFLMVSGHPGSTDRQDTVGHVEYLRDKGYPMTLDLIRRWEVLLKIYSQRSPENARRAKDLLSGVQNWRKSYLGGLNGLQDPDLIQYKKEKQKELRQKIAKLLNSDQDPWETIDKSLAIKAKHNVENLLFERGYGFHNAYFKYARALVRHSQEKVKPNSERLPEFSDSSIASTKQRVLAKVPVYADLEVAKFANAISLMTEWAGADDPAVQAILEDRSPQEAAYHWISQSKLDDPKVREKLFNASTEELKKNKDPFIQFAFLVDERARKVRKLMEEKVSTPMEKAYGEITRAQYKADPQGLYPDATFTLRLAFGKIASYQDQGQTIPAFTQMKGMFEKADMMSNEGDYKIPESWAKAKKKLDLSTPMNFICTADITGGNSGSPAVNKDGELIGLIFDGNLPSLRIDFVYEETKARALCVDVRALTEALDKVYHADEILKEIGIKSKPTSKIDKAIKRKLRKEAKKLLDL